MDISQSESSSIITNVNLIYFPHNTTWRYALASVANGEATSP
ncbi:hypothetical protein ES288_A03G048900v1 [Gossypium darwinii]|uniref:Uncharacterized protein n=2 Tax=Gossypium TaxID=3633 RepID=A0A5D2R6C9_GOSTO|nr:hypothetical protein ES288_A03G048900v1 [Gossypium darwinii]TYI35054.1 hypothetical protein ES332_A03G049300v1 [Gossypium tomentosum]